MLASGLIPYWWEIFLHAQTIQHQLDVYRNIENAFAVKHLKMEPNEALLDVGSGDSALPTFMLRKYKGWVYCCDIEEKNLQTQKKYLSRLEYEGNQFQTHQENMTKLSYPDESFHWVSLISCVEHLEGENDIQAMKEIERVLKPGGTCVVTVPGCSEPVEKDSTLYYDGFERRYTPEMIRERLIPFGMEPKETLYLNAPKNDFVFDLYKEIGNPIDLWYRKKWNEKYHQYSILPSILFVKVEPEPDSSVFGICLALKKF